MINKQIEKLRTQISKLDDKNFDLEAWKKHSIILLDSIFGGDNQKIKQIEKIEYEYNSWSLRDTSGHTTYLESCKKIGREVLGAAIEELEMTGIPEKSDEDGKINVHIILDALDDELKGSQYKTLMKLLKSDISTKEKSRQLQDIIKELGNETVINILQGIIMHEDFVGALPD
ncbi:MAG: hypothetical protein K9H16_07315 [Bacteroidales bacterium]|nr:hypothetical protein [Bacteroidales bacterium]